MRSKVEALLRCQVWAPSSVVLPLSKSAKKAKDKPYRIT
jgi:hypothetical protein